MIAGFFFAAFLHFVLSLRYYNHAAYLIRLPTERLGTQGGQGAAQGAAEGIADTLNRAGGHYNRGTRVFLLVLPFLLWLIGPDWFLGGVLVTLSLLYRFDYRTEGLARIAPTQAAGDFEVGDPHALFGDDVLVALDSRREGLTAAEAARRLAAVGPNLLPVPPRDGPLKRFFKHFHDILIYILLGAAVATAAMGYWVDTWVILAVAVVNATIGFLQEGKAEEALEGIRKMLSAHARALRDGAWVEIEAETLVPGDIVRLGPGARVPADLRLLEAANLRIEESALTGESLPTAKDLEPVADEAGIGDRRSMAYSGTLVTGGQGLGVVTGTGAATEIGRINRMLAEVQSLETPLTRQMTAFGRGLSLVILVLAVVMVLVGLLLHGQALRELFMAAIGFAVAAIPAGLPAIMTVTLALGVQRMVAAQRHHPQTHRGGDPGLGDRDLFGQDRHPDPQRDDGAPCGDPGRRVRRGRDRLCAGGPCRPRAPACAARRPPGPGRPGGGHGGVQRRRGQGGQGPLAPDRRAHRGGVAHPGPQGGAGQDGLRAPGGGPLRLRHQADGDPGSGARGRAPRFI